ncbi:unnamed protein product [Dicrocoelium dendriticum]|nr:unnamed protein product [Dicrocoelium dendriticum]
MPIRLNFKRTHRYNVSAKDLHVIKIYTLDGTCVEYTVTSTTTGKDALEYVSQRLDIDNICVFGLRYEGWSGDSRWLFLNKSVKKQLDRYARQHVLTLTVMLFINNPQFISDTQLRRFFYLQLREDVATGLLPVTLKLGIKLSAYSLQADFGDFINVDTTLANWRARSSTCGGKLCGAFDLSTTEYVDDILWGYLHLQGVSQDNAIWYFLDEIRHIPRYGVRTFRGMTCQNEPAELGVSRNGIIITMLEPEKGTTTNLKWEHIKDLTYSRKTFTIQTLKKSKAVHFVFDNSENARYLWQFCIQMHSSYIEYWTHMKSSPQQPAIHISEPPDILRGTESRYTNPDSPMHHDIFPDGSNFSLVPSVTGPGRSPEARNEQSGGSSGSASKPAMQSSAQLSVNNSTHNEEYRLTSEQMEKGTTAQVLFARDPDLLLATSETKDKNDITPLEGRTQSPSHLALLAAIHEATAESESGTLVGQWSLRSAADTLDSQMINQGCVTCLSGRDWLRPTGWFQPRAGVTNHSMSSKAIKASINTELQTKDGDKRRLMDKRTRIHRGHQRRHHQGVLEQQHKDECGTDANRRDERNQATGRVGPPEAGTSNFGIHLGTSGRILIDNVPLSPSSLLSSDSSSEHGIVSSHASFSSSSSSCSESRKKPTMGHCDSEDESCSSDSSSTSSIRSNLDARCENERNKKSPFGLTAAAALCSTTHGGSARSGVKLEEPRTTGLGQQGRRLWPPDTGGLRPLLAGFGQHHYRPQLELKRQQACTNNVRSEQQPLDKTNSRDASSINTPTRLPLTKSPSRARKPQVGRSFQDFQRWLLEAKQKLPNVWSNTVASRGMTLHISAPITDQNEAHAVETMKHMSESRTLERPVPLTDSGVLGQHAISPVYGQRARLARSSSETCAHQLTETNPSSHPETAICLQNVNHVSMGYPLERHGNNTGSLSRSTAFGITPAIRLYPASPNQSPYVQQSPSSLTSEPPSQDGTMWGCGVPTEIAKSAISPRSHTTEEGGVENSTSIRIISQEEVGSQNGLETMVEPAQAPFQRQRVQRAPPSWRLVPSSAAVNAKIIPDITGAEKEVGKSGESGTRSAFVQSGTRFTIQQRNYSSPPGQQYDGDGNEAQVLPRLPQPDSQKPDFTTVGPSSAAPTCTSKLPQSGTGVSALKLDQLAANLIPCSSTQFNGGLVAYNRPKIAGKSSTINLSHFLTNQSPLQNLEQPALPSTIGDTVTEGGPQFEIPGTSDDLAPQLNPTLTNSSSSEQSSSLRQSSNGPLHLLTNSDIHQLLSLTNIKETELAHRLLVEYRLALLQQQSLHTNSVSTPNLTASQELQMNSSTTAAEETEEANFLINGMCTEREKKIFKCSSTQPTDNHKDTSNDNHVSPKNSPVNNPHRRRRHGQPSHSSKKKSSARLGSVKRMHSERGSIEESGPLSIDSPDYVNAAAFRTNSMGYEDRPLSLASSTDMESNGTFRVLSSTETRGSSGAGWSTGNLTGPGASFGSTDVTCNSMDLTQSLGLSHNGTTEVTLANRSWDHLPQSKRLGLIHAGNGRRRGVVPMPELNESTTRSSSIAGINLQPDVCAIHNQEDAAQLHLEHVVLSEKTVENPDCHKSNKRTAHEAYENISYFPERSNQEVSKAHGKLVQKTCSPTDQANQMTYSNSAYDEEVTFTPNLDSVSVCTLTHQTTSLPESTLSDSHTSLASASTLSSSTSGATSSLSNSEISSDMATSLGGMHREMHSDSDASASTGLRSPALHPFEKCHLPTTCDEIDKMKRNARHHDCCLATSPTVDSMKKLTSENTCRNANKLKDNSSSRGKYRHCSYECCAHGKRMTTVAKSGSLRCSSGKQNASQHSTAGRSEIGRSNLKGSSFDPYVKTAGADTSEGQRSKPSRHIRTSESFKLYQATRPRRCHDSEVLAHRAKTCLRNSPMFSKQEKCVFYSDEEDPQEICCYSDLNLHNNDGSTSATLSPVESPCLSSASSYSYSLSSLDIKTEEPPLWYSRYRRHRRSNNQPHQCKLHRHHHHFMIERVNTGGPCRKERIKRGGSLDPSLSSPMKPHFNVLRKKRSSQPATNYRILCHKGGLEVSSRTSPSVTLAHRHACCLDNSDSSSNRHCPCVLSENSEEVFGNTGRDRPLTTTLKKGVNSRPQQYFVTPVFTPSVYRKSAHRHHNRKKQVDDPSKHIHQHDLPCLNDKANVSDAVVDTGKPPVAKRKSNESPTSLDSPIQVMEEKGVLFHNWRIDSPAKPVRPKDLTFLLRQTTSLQASPDTNARSSLRGTEESITMSRPRYQAVKVSELLENRNSPTNDRQQQQHTSLESRYSPRPSHHPLSTLPIRAGVRPSSLSYRVCSGDNYQQDDEVQRAQSPAFQTIGQNDNSGKRSHDSYAMHMHSKAEQLRNPPVIRSPTSTSAPQPQHTQIGRSGSAYRVNNNPSESVQSGTFRHSPTHFPSTIHRSITMSPTSPTLLYTTSVVVKPPAPNGIRTGPSFDRDKYSLPNDVTDISSNKSGGACGESNAAIIRSGSLDPSDLLVRQEVIGVKKATSTTFTPPVKFSGQQEAARKQHNTSDKRTQGNSPNQTEASTRGMTITASGTRFHGPRFNLNDPVHSKPFDIKSRVTNS